GFEATTTDTASVLADGEINAIVITTRHDSHARLVCQALGAGKHVFVEKPLALTLPELSAIGRARAASLDAGHNPLMMVGFNRRFAPQVQKMKTLLKRVTWNFIARLGAGAFETISGEVVKAILLTLTSVRPDEDIHLNGIDVSHLPNAQDKALALKADEILRTNQLSQLNNPDARIGFDSSTSTSLLSDHADGLVGLQTSDDPMFVVAFWEQNLIDKTVWEFMQATPNSFTEVDGLSWLVRWEQGNGLLLSLPTAFPTKGLKALGKPGVAVHRMGRLFGYRYGKERFHQNVALVLPKQEENLAAIWCYCTSSEFGESVRRIDKGLKVTNATLVKVPFDLAHWRQVAAERYPNGLPKPYSDDPTQWIFHGHPQSAIDPLQVAVARLLGYTWPAKSDAAMELSDETRTWIARCQALAAHADDDGIVCLPAVRGEKPCQERLLSLLIDAWETVQPGSWKSSILDKLLADVDCAGKGLEVWLREKFFEQHSKRFHHRPFVWHIWDGLKDGFGALVNYHKLDNKNLERLIHTYLGDWIRAQEQGTKDGVDGAQTRLAAARNLKARLEAILEGEAPHDIFVRWKPLAQQSIGWNPDLNDGVRLNIRPFMQAEVLRHNKKPKLNITWDKDRGKDVGSAPWFAMFKGERINDHHLTLEEKRRSRG
ncbi:MAG: Gfo/Idh/MocA family oxidoreductase, partial [Burkholderiales bacterium]|nr:Gfo/Idh/MocA family oxidoreductase [Burkholderiales bacterium]